MHRYILKHLHTHWVWLCLHPFKVLDTHTHSYILSIIVCSPHKHTHCLSRIQCQRNQPFFKCKAMFWYNVQNRFNIRRRKSTKAYILHFLNEWIHSLGSQRLRHISHPTVPNNQQTIERYSWYTFSTADVVSCVMFEYEMRAERD